MILEPIRENGEYRRRHNNELYLACGKDNRYLSEKEDYFPWSEKEFKEIDKPDLCIFRKQENQRTLVHGDRKK